MTSIVELFPKCQKLAYDVRQQLSQVQNGVMYPSDLYMALDELSMQLDVMDNLVLKEIPSQRELWKRKILELREESKTIRRNGEYYDRVANQNVRHQREREELLRRRRQRNPGATEDERDMHNYADEAQSLNQSNLMVNELLANGEAGLSGLLDQRRKMRNVTGVLTEMGNRMGLTQSAMRIIERRDVTDAYLVFAMMIVTCIVFYVVWFAEWF